MEQTTQTTPLTHWKKLENPDYIGAYAFEPGQDMILTIRDHARARVVGNDGREAEKTVLYFAENVKPLVLNRTNAKRLERMFRTPYLEQWKGRRIQLYVEHNVKAFGELCDGVRVRPDPPAEERAVCFDCGREIEAYGKMTPRALFLYTRKAYGRSLCAGCAAAAKEARDAEGGSAAAVTGPEGARREGEGDGGQPV